jgi:Tfp pilus assembly protein PilO
MTRFVLPIVLIVIAIFAFFMFTNPIFNDISVLKAQVASYNEALNNSKALENERDILTAKYNTIDPDNLLKLQKLLPDNIDNIRLILEIGQIASPYGMTLTNVKYNATSGTNASASAVASAATVQGGAVPSTGSNDYGTFNLEFSTSGSYNNFINFTKDLENNLRIVDISSIVFSSNLNANLNPKANSPEIYTYDFKIKTYYLKN